MLRRFTSKWVGLAGVLAWVIIGALGLAGAASDAAFAEGLPPVVSVDLPAGATVPASGVGEVQFGLKIEKPWHLYAVNKEGYIPLSVGAGKEMPEGVTVGAATFDAKPHVIDFFGQKVPVYEGLVPVRLAVEVSAEVGSKLSIPFTLAYQACDDASCLSPTTEEHVLEVEVVAGEGGAVEAAPAASAGDDGATAEVGAPEPESSGLLWETILAFGAGFLVTLTPCVYPLIPVTITYFEQQGGSRAKTLPLALAYGAGIIAMYTTLGVVMAKIGQDLGSILGNPFVAWGFVALFIALSLSMFGYFELALPSSVATKLQSGERSGVAGAFLLGLTLGLVAAPCVGPVAGGLMLYVATQGDLLFGVVTFAAFGFGIALPFMALGMFTGRLSSVPRAGAWMNGIKAAFGWLILLFVIYFTNVAAGSEALLLALVGLYLFFGGITARSAGKQKIEKASEGTVLGMGLFGGGALAAAAGVYFLFGPYVLAEDGPFVPPQELFASEVDWQKGDHDALLAEARAAGKPVVIDFTARWCAPCQEMELTTFRDPVVVKEFERFVAIKIDVTSDAVAQKLKIDRYKSFSVPFIAFYDSKGTYLGDRALSAKPSTAAFLQRLKEIP